MNPLNRTMEIYDAYERRFAEAAYTRPKRFSPYRDRQKEIREAAMRLLAICEEQIPTIGGMTPVSATQYEAYEVTSVRYESFPHCYGAADIYTPHGEGPFPVVFLFPGHSEYGRKGPAYRAMCHRMAASGAMVVSPDGMGQGDRLPMEHKRAYAVFSAGITLQGMMILEALGLIRYFARHPRADPARLAACGNSGGGTQCLFLAAAAPELSAVVSSGYPSDFGYIHEKERYHCACNLLPGCARGPEMWEVLSACAPRPLLLLEGEGDHLIPLDYFHRTARKVRYAYEMLDAKTAFRAVTVKDGHSWTEKHISVIAEFLCGVLGLTPAADTAYSDFDGTVPLPADFANVYEVAQFLTGRTIDPATPLSAIFPPACDGVVIQPEEIVPDLGRGELMQIWAQMECALWEG